MHAKRGADGDVRFAFPGGEGSIILHWLREDGAFSGSQLVLRQGGIAAAMSFGHAQQRCCMSVKISELRLDVQRSTMSVLFTCHTQATEFCSRVQPDESGPQFRKAPLLHVPVCDTFVGGHFYETHRCVAQTNPDSSCVRKPPARSDRTLTRPLTGTPLLHNAQHGEAAV